MSRLTRYSAFVLLLSAVHCADAQPAEAPPAPVRPARKVPVVAPQAQKYLEALETKYQGLRSYSDKTVVEVKDQGMLGARRAAKMGFEAKISFARPDKSRFEGTNAAGPFLGVSDGKTVWAQMAGRPGTYVQRTGSIWAIRDPIEELDLQLSSQPTFFEKNSFKRMLGGNMADSVAVGQDADVNGISCHSVEVRASSPNGMTIITTYFVGATDGVLYRQTSDIGWGANRAQTIETHSEVRLDPDLPPTTWEFTPAATDKRVETFLGYDPHTLDPKINVGQAIVPFKATATDGTMVSLADWRGNPVILYFYAKGANEDAVPLGEVARKYAGQGLKVVGVAFVTKPQDVPTGADGKPLPYPFVINETGKENDIMALEKNEALGWMYLIDREGKVVRVGKDLSDLEFSGDIERTLQAK